jgi:hypothetical protein
MDSVGGAPLGLRAAQHIADRLVDSYRIPAIGPRHESLRDLRLAANRSRAGPRRFMLRTDNLVKHVSSEIVLRPQFFPSCLSALLTRLLNSGF